MSDGRVILSDKASRELKRINEIIQKPHLLIGGLAVKQYVPQRESYDIDLICDHNTASSIVKKLYENQKYYIHEENKDDLRPDFKIVPRPSKDFVIRLGIKITEREPYKYLQWDKLSQESVEYRYQKESLNKIHVPSLEMLAYTKILSFVNRIKKIQEKGESDLMDFVSLSNIESFKVNTFVDLVGQFSAYEYIKEQLLDIKQNHNIRFLDEKAFGGLFSLFNMESRVVSKKHSDGVDDKCVECIRYTPDDAVHFYDEISDYYNSRNIEVLYQVHQRVIRDLDKLLLNKRGSVTDVGSGTGIQIAAHFSSYKDVVWYSIDGSVKMQGKFKFYMSDAAMQCEYISENVQSCKWDTIEKSNVVLVCFVLTSTDDRSWLLKICEYMPVGARLLIADIHPTTISRSPIYDFEVGDKRWELELVPCYQDVIAQKLKRKGLEQIAFDIYNDQIGREYAYYASYEKK